MKIYHIILGFFAFFAVIFEAYFGIASVVGFFIQNILLAAILALFIYLLSSSQSKNYRKIFSYTLLSFMAFVGVLLTTIAGFVTYQNLNPAELADITLSDGSGSVVFVQMSHIATPDFFATKNTKIQSLASSGYTILMEGVHSGSSENHAKFDAYMGFRFTETLYESIALFTGLASQDNAVLYTGVDASDIVSVDLSIDDIVTIIGDARPIIAGDIPDIEGELSQLREHISSQEKKVFSLIFRAFLNWSLKNSHDFESRLVDQDTSGIFYTIIHKRNTPIIEYIRTHPGQKIAIVYGALHFNGVYEGLQHISPNWKIQNIVKYTPYK